MQLIRGSFLGGRSMSRSPDHLPGIRSLQNYIWEGLETLDEMFLDTRGWFLLLLTMVPISIFLIGCSSPPNPSPSAQSLTNSTATQFNPTDTSTPTPNPPSATPSPSATSTPTSTPTWASIGPGPIKAPILLYHKIRSEDGLNRYRIHPTVFESQMRQLDDLGYQTVTVSRLYDSITKGTEMPPKPIIITFDDGYIDVIDYAFPIMEEFGFIGTVYIVANRIGADGFLSAEQLKMLAAGGWEIGSHSTSHTDLTTLSSSQVREEVHGSRLRIGEETGLEIDSFAYPFGSFTEEIGLRVARYGYQTAVGLGKGLTHDLGTVYYLSRREVHGTMTQEDFTGLLTPK